MTPQTARFQTPTTFEMLETFSVDPVAAEPDEGLMAYQWTDGSGLSLRLSWSLFERSVQVTLRLGDRELATVCQEGAVRLSVRAEKGSLALVGEFQQGAASGRLTVEIEPALKVSWSILDA